LHDNNIFYFYPDLPEPQALPVVFGWVENKGIVTDIIERSQKSEARSQKAEVETDGGQGVGSGESGIDLQVGDELVEFDGKTVPELIAEHRLQFSYSTEGAFYRHMTDMLGFGAAGAEVKLVFRRSRDMTEGCTPSDSGRALSKMGTVPCEGTVPILHVTLKRTVTREAWVAHLARKRQSRGYGLLHGNIG
jgi:hypothetical protein